MKISELYGHMLVADGKKGYIICVNGGENGAVSLTCADENEREFTVSAESITKRGETFFATASKMSPKTDKPIRLGRAVYDEKGTFLGTLEDMFLSSANKIIKAKVGKKNYPAENLVCGDVYILKFCKKLKSDVKKDGKILFKKGVPVTDEILSAAQDAKEYVQTKLKTL